MSYEFTPTATSADKIEQYASLLSLVFSETDKFTPAFLNWQYAQNPNGIVVGYDAYFNGTLAAHYVTIPVVYTINGKTIKVLLSLNTATHPEHQGKGLFTQLATKTYELAKQQGYEFVIGVANQNSTHGFLKKLGFYLIAPLDVKIGTGKLSLHNHFEKYKLKALWNDESVHWRLSNPSAKYFKKNEFVYAHSGKLNIYAVMGQTAHAAKHVATDKKNLITSKLWIGIADHKKLSGIFPTLPEKLKPSPLNLIFKDLSGTLPQFNKSDVYFELMDFDAY